MKHRFHDDAGAGPAVAGLSRRAFIRRATGLDPHLPETQQATAESFDAVQHGPAEPEAFASHSAGGTGAAGAVPMESKTGAVPTDADVAPAPTGAASVASGTGMSSSDGGVSTVSDAEAQADAKGDAAASDADGSPDIDANAAASLGAAHSQDAQAGSDTPDEAGHETAGHDTGGEAENRAADCDAEVPADADAIDSVRADATSEAVAVPSAEATSDADATFEGIAVPNGAAIVAADDPRDANVGEEGASAHVTTVDSSHAAENTTEQDASGGKTVAGAEAGADAVREAGTDASAGDEDIESQAVSAGAAPQLTVGSAYQDSEDSIAIEAPRQLEGSFDLIIDRPLSLTENLAIDQAVAQSVRIGARPAAVRFWGWEGEGLLIGSDAPLAASQANVPGAEVARRATPAPLVRLHADSCIAYSVIAPQAQFVGLNDREVFAVCDAWALRALRGLGVPVIYRDASITTPDGSVSIAVERKLTGGVLVHHTVLTVTQRSGISPSIADLIPTTRQAVHDALVAELERGRSVRAARLVPREVVDAEKLAVAKFATEAWLRRVH